MDRSRKDDILGIAVYGDRTTKCRKCRYSVYDKLKKENKWMANISCFKYIEERKPRTTYTDDKNFKCKFFEEKV